MLCYPYLNSENTQLWRPNSGCSRHCVCLSRLVYICTSDLCPDSSWSFYSEFGSLIKLIKLTMIAHDIYNFWTSELTCVAFISTFRRSIHWRYQLIVQIWSHLEWILDVVKQNVFCIGKLILKSMKTFLIAERA